MEKIEYTNVFNSLIKGQSVDLSKVLFMITEYLADIKFKKVDKMINFLTQNPTFIQMTIPTLEPHFCKKYNICKLYDVNGKTIKYYD